MDDLRYLPLKACQLVIAKAFAIGDLLTLKRRIHLIYLPNAVARICRCAISGHVFVVAVGFGG